LFQEECPLTSAYTTPAAATPIVISCLPCVPLTSVAHRRRSPKRNMTLTKTVSAYAYQAADTRHTKLTSQAGTTRATRFYAVCLHGTGGRNPHCHNRLTTRPLDERRAWAAKSKKEYDLDENGERLRLPSGRYKTHKVDLTGWNDKGNALLWRKAWADISNAYLERAGHPERIDYRSNAERGIDELPTVQDRK